MIEPTIPGKLVFSRAWQLASFAMLLAVALGVALVAVSQLA